MYIEPNTDIKLIKNSPCDSRYINTLYFPTLQEQTTYFSSIVKYNLTNYTYQRVNKGVLRVGIPAENLYDCNYMMFRNHAFGNKWFYAFINKVEYVNNSMSEIVFDIDVMQTWLTDYDINACFIEREHTLTDAIGQNLVAEPLALGEMVYDEYAPIVDMTHHAIIVCVNDVEAGTVEGHTYNLVYSGSTIWIFNSSDTSGVDNLLAQYVENPDSIVAIYMCPKNIIYAGDIPIGGKKITSNIALINGVEVEGTKLYGNEKFDDYTPKNNKLYTYPYNFYHVDNANGQSMELRYEFFKDLHPKFRLFGNMNLPVNVVISPVNYKNVEKVKSATGYHDDSSRTLNTEKVVMGGYPMCSWNTDAFKAWVAQNAAPTWSKAGLATGIAVAGVAVAGTVATVATGGAAAPLAVGATASTASAVGGASALAGAGVAIASIGSALTSTYKASIQADIMGGNISSGNANFSNDKQQFYSCRVRVTKEFARIIDSFFSRFGYACNKVKVPYLVGRPHWNYTKTIGCTIKGNLPADDNQKICSIFDNGITFWKHPNEVGNFNLDNSPQFEVE